MNKSEQKRALTAAVRAARAAGRLMRQNLHRTKTVNLATSHDIKLELDVRCQQLIERTLRGEFPRIALLGEEGDSGDVNATCRWVVDPIDGTVNFAYGIPHAAVSIALEIRADADTDPFKAVAGVIYDPFQDELWTAIRGEPARCNGRVIHVSKRAKTSEAIVTIGFAKSLDNLRKSLPYFGRLAPRVRKVRIMGSAALALTYVAMGRFDAYVERGISLWDIAAGGLILECAGGEFWTEPVPGRLKFRMIASNGRLRPRLAIPV
ncbi:MAG: inositol monophosphatase [Verrucomicrobia bacterium]|jgi:myo-inositol-1(or 4)-monophosphatase|nr:inositol monophosphatase [Verrucomicrobiota bacterium]